jgi:squalene-hopene/tetraprenyl-beta-curcumene cyclase
MVFPRSKDARIIVCAWLTLCWSPGRAVAEDWSPKLAAEYLDSRQREWFAWGPAKAAGGPCVSCHTGATYLLARSALRRRLREVESTRYEAGLLAGLRSRSASKNAADAFPAFTKEPLASQALGVEAVHAALFLALADTTTGTWSPETGHAFDRMWSLQVREGKSKGTWPWFDLELDPWETGDSSFYGATLAAMAVGAAPAGYRTKPEVAPRVADLADYLRREQQSQPLHNRLMLVWAGAKLRKVISGETRQSIIDEAWKKQDASGGWTIDALGTWMQHSNAPPASGTSTYATALTAYVLQKAGVNSSDTRLLRALKWLASQQDPQSGHWAAQSMNKPYKAGSMPDRFMQDAATAFSALALLEAGSLGR